MWMTIRAISQEPLDLATPTHIYRERVEMTEDKCDELEGTVEFTPFRKQTEETTR